ncbi:MAG: tRNA(Ile)-lysidine synthase [Patescibacteria group bacterium]|nr:tRNA(Ile)-lysidine synthase [Patescibacteria group bacterium]
MVRYIVAVSGGVDSVALLHMLVHERPDDELIVAHFDHGIRSESAADAAFVMQLADKYGLPFVSQREELGPNASEELARHRRYAFLRSMAKKHHATIITAHHADDVVETIAINLTRGTGWRGLAVLNSGDIERPLLSCMKADLIAYAQRHKLEWREDATNQDTKYLRNDLRQRLTVLDPDSHRLLLLYRDRQCFLRQMVDNEIDRLVGASPYSRHMFIAVSDIAAQELLRGVFVKEGVAVPTRPQIQRALHAVKVLHAGKSHNVATGISLRFTKTHFVVELARKVVS